MLLEELTTATDILASKTLQIKTENCDNLKILVENVKNEISYKDPHACSICEKVFKQRAYLERHVESVHFKTNKIFCDLCPKIFFTEVDLKFHIRYVHGEKSFACNICDYKTAVKTNFKRHNLTHGVKVEFPICKKKVVELKTDTKAHRPKEFRYVHGEKSFACYICDYKTSVKSNLKRHKLTHGAKVGCPICKKKVAHLKLHMNTHNIVHRPKEFCQICQKHYSKNNFKRHLKSHITFFACNVCDFKSSSKTNLHSHMLSHDIKVNRNMESLVTIHEKAQKCKGCGQTFNSKRGLKE